MNKNLIIGIVAVVILAVIGFVILSNRSSQPTETTTDEMAIQPPTFSGTYTGVLPCADCTGLETSITFTPSASDPNMGTFTMSEVYQGKSTEPMTSNGTYTVTSGTPTNPNAQVVELVTEGQDPEFYMVSENSLQMLSSDKTPIDAPFNTSLTKQAES